VYLFLDAFLLQRPFSGKHLKQTEEGVYLCVVCDNQLFRSDQKFESGCGWPSFSDVLAQGTVTFNKDTSQGQYNNNNYYYRYRHNIINDIIHCSLSKAGILSIKDPRSTT